MFFRRSDPTPRTFPRQLRAGWRAWVPAALLCVAVGWRVCALLPAAEPAERPGYRDVYHTILARNALMQDPVLAPLNLGVRVHDRVATLWGPAPSAQVMQRAVAVLSKLPDLLDVRCEMHLESQDELRPQYLPEPLPGQPPAMPPPPPPLPGLSREDAVRGVLTKRPANAGEAVRPADNLRLGSIPKPGFPTPNGDDPNEPVLPSITVPQGVPTAVPAAQNWSSVQLAVNSLRQGDTRFRGLRAEARDGQVLLSGSATSWDDVRDFAAGLNRLPGVERVILGQVRTER